MQTAFVLPGLNSLLNPKARLRFLDIPEVQARLRLAEDIIQKQHGRTLDFNALLRLPTQQVYSRPLISDSAMGIVALQVGIADALIKRAGTPAWVVGCSLGDLARTVIARCCSFETALGIPLIAPQNEAGADQVGSTVAVMAPAARPFSSEELSWISDLGVDTCRLSHKLLNVSGRFADIDRLFALARKAGWKVLPLLDYPVHSRYLSPYKEILVNRLRSVRFEAPSSGVRVFSTLLVKEIQASDELRFEMENSLVLPHHWHESIDVLVNRHEVTRFVNLGPCQTLSKLLRQFPAKLEVFEPEELVRHQLQEN